MAGGITDFRFGRLYFPTLTDDVQEAVGDALQADEAGVAVARRRPRPFTFTIPVHAGAGDSDPYTAGERMRRQVRSMMENSIYRLQGIYMALAFDAELGGWVIGGSGQIKYADGGITTGQFSMELDSAFRVGTLRTNRPARRVEAYDRRISTTPRDYRGVIYGTDFATGGGPLALTPIPPGAADALAYNRVPVVLYARAGIDGVGYVAANLAHANVVDYEQAEASHNLGDVVLYDRRGLGGVTSNYVPNPGFRYDTLAGAPAVWSASTPSYFVNANATLTVVNPTSDAVFSYHQAMQIATTASPANQGAAIPLGTLPAGTYTASLYAYGNGNMQAEAGQANGTATYSNLTITASWARYNFQFTTDGTAPCYLVIRNVASSAVTVVVSNVMVAPGGTLGAYVDGDAAGYVWAGTAGQSVTFTTLRPEGTPGHINLIPNGAFAHDTPGAAPAGWTSTYATGTVTTTGAYSLTSGTLAAAATVTTTANGPATTPANGMPATPGRTYTLRGLFAAVANTTTATSFLRLSWYDATGALLSSATSTGGTPAGVLAAQGSQASGTTQYVTATAPTGTAYMVAAVVSAGGASGGTSSITIDQLMLTTGPLAAYADGDTTGWRWTGGQPGNSVSMIDPQAYGHEEVYGPDYPLTPGDVVVMQNGHCRIRYVAAYNALAIDTYVAGYPWVEQGRVTILDTVAQDTFNAHTYAIPQANGALSVVLEWTPERGVFRISTTRSATAATCRIDTYVSLQRGWLGPRIESYCVSNTFGAAGVQIRWTPAVGGALAATYTWSGATEDTQRNWISTVDAWPGITGPLSSFSSADFYSTALPLAGNPASTPFAVLASIQSLARWSRAIDTDAYGTTRSSVNIVARYNESQVTVGGPLYGYASLFLGFAAQPATGLPAFMEAEAYRNASDATATQVADAAASNGQAVNETRTASNLATPTIQTAVLPAAAQGTFLIYVRARVVTAGDTYTLNTGFTGSNATLTINSTTYTWINGGQLGNSGTTNRLYIDAYRSAGTGTGGVNIDAIMLVPYARRGLFAGDPTTFDGPKDQADIHLYDQRAVPDLVLR